MMRYLLLCFALFLISISSKLYQIVAMLSPGARYHLNQLYDGKDTISQWGQITPVGLRQMQNLGKINRKQYIQKNNLLNKDFKLEQFQIYSKSSNRSIISSLSHLYGIYSLQNGQKIQHVDPKYHIPPYKYKNQTIQNKFAIPFGQLLYIVKQNKDLLQICPNQQLQIKKNIKERQVQYNQMVLTYTPFLKLIANIFKINVSEMDFNKLSNLYDTVNVDRYLNRKLPQELNKPQLGNMQHLYNWYYHLTISSNLAKAYNTFKINKVLSNFQNIIKNPSSSLKWSTLSVDLKDIVALRNDLNISSAKCIQQLYRKGSTSSLNCQTSVPFGSSLIFQLHSDNQKDFYVRIKNNGKYIFLCEQKNINCDFQVWKNRIAKSIINPQSICGKIQDKSQNQWDNSLSSLLQTIQ